MYLQKVQIDSGEMVGYFITAFPVCLNNIPHYNMDLDMWLPNILTMEFKNEL